MNVLVIDVGGNHVKILATGQKQSREFPSGPTLTAKQMVAGVKKLASDWKYDVVSIGYPGPVLRNRPIAEPINPGRGWVGCDFRGAFNRPVKVVNDAAMQALGSYRRGKMLFLGLGTGLGSTMVADGIASQWNWDICPTRKEPMRITWERVLEEAGKKEMAAKCCRRYQPSWFSTNTQCLRKASFGTSTPLISGASNSEKSWLSGLSRSSRARVSRLSGTMVPQIN